MMYRHGALLFMMFMCLGNIVHSFNVVKSSRFTRTITRATTDLRPQTSDVTAPMIRALELFDAAGMKQDLGSIMGADKSVVVFLRHLG
jgi:hypothetical protein